MTFITLGPLSIPVSMWLLGISLTIGLIVLLIEVKKHSGRLSKPFLHGGLTSIGTYAVFSIVIIAARSHAVLPQTAYMQLNGELLSISEISQQRPIVVNLWASSCEPCRQDLAILDKAEITYSDIAFVSLNQRESSHRVKEFMRIEGFTLQNVLLDSKAEIATNKGLFSLPVTLFYDANGQLLYSHPGMLTADILDQTIITYF